MVILDAAVEKPPIIRGYTQKIISRRKTPEQELKILLAAELFSKLSPEDQDITVEQMKCRLDHAMT